MPTPPWWLFVLPLLAGACLPLQAGINGQLAKQVSSVLAACSAARNLARICAINDAP